MNLRSLGLATLRQHRFAILTNIVLTAALAVLLLVLINMFGSIQPGTLVWTEYDPRFWARALYLPTALVAVMAVFVAAPLVSREYEARTHLLAWSQDVSPTRWLAGKVVVLGGAAVLLAVVSASVALGLVGVFRRTEDNFYFLQPFDTLSFDANVLVLTAHMLFGFALGVAASVLTRRTLLAMGLTLVGFLGIRALITMFVRPYYLTPVHSYRAWNFTTLQPGQEYIAPVPADALSVNSGFADAAGNPVEFPHECAYSGSFEAQTRCLTERGVAGAWAEYQPVERLLTFQLMETGVFVVLAAALFGCAFFWIRRRQRV